MAVKKKENKATNTEELEVTENGLQNEEKLDKEVEEKEENTVSPEEPSDGITVSVPVSEPTPASTGDKMVKIKPNCNTRFYYGNVWYHLVRDTVMTVPQEVKIRLSNAGKLSAL